MATYQLPDGRTVSDSMSFILNDTQYPSNWLLLSSQEDRELLNIAGPLLEPPWYDQRFYWSPSEPKDHTLLVAEYIAHTKRNAGSLLSDTDWYITRASETGLQAPQSVLNRRAEIRTLSNTKEALLEATTTTDELAAYVTGPTFNVWETPAPEEGEDTLSFEQP